MVAELTTGDRLAALLDALGLERAHFALSFGSDWREALTLGDRMASLSMVIPYFDRGVPTPEHTPHCPTLMITGSEGQTAEIAAEFHPRLPRGRLEVIPDYEPRLWSDIAREKGDIIVPALLSFLKANSDDVPVLPADAPPKGSTADLSYEVHGSGPALIVAALMLAPSQWEPILPELSKHFAVVLVGGAEVGPVKLLEERWRYGYGDMVAGVVRESMPEPVECILEVGCGPGTVLRAIAPTVSPTDRVTGIDVNAFLVSEAEALARVDGLTNVDVGFGDATAIPFDDETFDLTLCFTVLEELDADRALAEIARVTRKSGHVALLVRAADHDWFTNLPVSEGLRRSMGAHRRKLGAMLGASPGGCADATLYARAAAAGLTLRHGAPRYCAYSGVRRDRFLPDMLDMLDAPERAELEAALEEPILVCEPYHVAILTKS